jgi:hypothetical protein
MVTSVSSVKVSSMLLDVPETVTLRKGALEVNPMNCPVLTGTTVPSRLSPVPKGLKLLGHEGVDVDREARDLLGEGEGHLLVEAEELVLKPGTETVEPGRRHELLRHHHRSLGRGHADAVPAREQAKPRGVEGLDRLVDRRVERAEARAVVEDGDGRRLGHAEARTQERRRHDGAREPRDHDSESGQRHGKLHENRGL